MPYQTPVKGYHVPEDGEDVPSDGLNGPLQAVTNSENWGDTIQTLIDQLDTDIPSVGLLSERPDVSTGLQLFFATDEQQWFYADGGAWQTGLPERTSLSVSSWSLLDVADHGYDGTESNDLTALFDANPDSLFVLPPGTYQMDSEYTNSNFDVFGLVGKPHATIRVTNPDLDFLLTLGSNQSGDVAKRAVIKNITFDITDTTEVIDCCILRSYLNEHFVLENVEVVGERQRHQDRDGDGTDWEYVSASASTFKMQMVEQDATGIVRGLRLPDGSRYPSQGTANDVGQVGNGIGINCEPSHVGTMLYEACYVEGWVDNGFYLTNPGGGKNLLLGCTARNCGNSNIRLGMNDRAIDCTSIWDDATNLPQTGVCLNIQDENNISVDGMDIVATDTVNDVVRIQDKCTGATLKNVSIDCDSDVKVLEANGATSGEVVSLENWNVDDSGAGSQYAAPLQVNRPDVHISDLILTTTQRHGVKVRADGFVLRDSFLDVAAGNSHILIGNSGDPDPDGGLLRLYSNTFVGGDGLYQYSSSTINHVALVDNDLTAITTPLGNISGTVGNWIVRDNPGFQTSQYGSVNAKTGTIQNLTVSSSVDFSENQLVNALLEQNPSWPTNPTQGRIVLDPDSDRVFLQTSGGRKQFKLLDAEIIADFENQSLSGWDRVDSAYSITAGAALSGNYGLFADGAGQVSGYMWSTEGSGLPFYPSAGQSFEVRWYPETTGPAWRLYFGLQAGSDDAYELNINVDGDDIILQKNEAGSGTTIASESNIAYGLGQPEPYRTRVLWETSNDITIRTFNQADTEISSFTVNDATFTSGGIGFYIGGSISVYIDDISLV